jgi:hypothetical protein
VVFLGGMTLAKHVAAGFMAMGVGVALGLFMF